MVACSNQIQQLSASCQELTQLEVKSKDAIGHLLTKLKDHEANTEQLLKGQKEFYESQLIELQSLITKQRSLLRPTKQHGRRYRNCSSECIQKTQLLEEENSYLMNQTTQLRSKLSNEKKALQSSLEELKTQFEQLNHRHEKQEEELRELRNLKERQLDSEISNLDGKIFKKLKNIENLLKSQKSDQESFPPLSPLVEFVE